MNRNNLSNSITNTAINRFGRYYTPGKSYSPSRIAECVDLFHVFRCQIGQDLMLDEFMKVSKIGHRNLALKIIYSMKFSNNLHENKQGHGHKGALSILDPNEELRVEMYFLYLTWRLWPIRSYQIYLCEKYGVRVSNRTISKWFTKNNW